jgi:hypothetical protein
MNITGIGRISLAKIGSQRLIATCYCTIEVPMMYWPEHSKEFGVILYHYVLGRTIQLGKQVIGIGYRSLADT